MKIVIEDGATNPSSIGSYKNTKNCEPIISQSMRTDKIVKGSYTKWHKPKLESVSSFDFQQYLEDWHLDIDMLRELIYNWIIEKAQLELAVDNDFISAEELSDNTDLIYSVVDDSIIPQLESYFSKHSDEDPKEFDIVISQDKECKDVINKLRDDFDYLEPTQYGIWDDLLESINEE